MRQGAPDRKRMEARSQRRSCAAALWRMGNMNCTAECNRGVTQCLAQSKQHYCAESAVAAKSASSALSISGAAFSGDSGSFPTGTNNEGWT